MNGHFSSIKFVVLRVMNSIRLGKFDNSIFFFLNMIEKVDRVQFQFFFYLVDFHFILFFCYFGVF
jgi:hypothetical protein